MQETGGRMRVSSRRQRGAIYFLMLFAVAVVAMGLAAAIPRYSDDVRYQREQELIRIGVQYVNAIGEFYRSSPGTLRAYPQSLDQLLLDPRYAGTRRYMRRLYPDPITGADWGLVQAPEGGIAGVFSKSEERPWIARRLEFGTQIVEPAARYSELKFVFHPVEPPK